MRVRFLRARVTLGLNSPRMRIKREKRAWRCCLGKIRLSPDFICRLLGVLSASSRQGSGILKKDEENSVSH